MSFDRKILMGLIAIGFMGWIGTTPEAAASKAGNFGGETKVNLIGYSGHAMEPFISRDGQHLFWNSLNDAVDTSIYYAKKIDDSNFLFVGKVGNVNGNPPHLDAVASMDMTGKFYWVSNRDYPAVFENYQSGYFENGVVKNPAPVQGNFYIKKPGWIIMDAEINHDGNLLFYINARFDGAPVPAETSLGVALKEGNRFIKDPNSDLLFAAINALPGLEYAPAFSANGLEIFFYAARWREDSALCLQKEVSQSPLRQGEVAQDIGRHAGSADAFAGRQNPLLSQKRRRPLRYF